LEESVRGRYRSEEFLQRARRELGLSSDDYGEAEPALSDLSQAAHEAAARDDDKRVAEIEAEVDEAAAELWGLTSKELAVIRKALREG
jgi:predicted DNA binding protein